jgi:hypothetical protein
METILKVVFAVCITIGRYSDRHTNVVRVFETKDGADRFVASSQRSVMRAAGMRDAVINMLSEWDKAHERPTYDYSDDESSRIFDKWADARQAEAERLEAITGYRKACEEAGLKKYDEPDDVYYSVSEVPFEPANRW